jgi:pimeloyl-ACP methyl ester carboxylesterase
MHVMRDTVGTWLAFIAGAAWVIVAMPGWCWAQEGARADSSRIPRIEWAEFPEELAPDAGNAKFGYLFVPENRHDPDNKNTIRLPFVILQSRNPSPAPDPILFTTGGPGVTSTVRAAKYFTKVRFINEMLNDRDFILFEQRGAKYAHPTLVGPEIDSVLINNIDGSLNGRPPADAFAAAVRRLRDRLTADGTDLSAYNSTESAADIADLRPTLGLDQLNLVGISYSCRLFLEVLRRHPEGIKAVVLDSPLAPDADWDETSVANYWGVMKSLFDAAAADSAANAAYPDLENRFLRLLTEVKRQPITVQTHHPLTKEPVTVFLDAEGVFHCACRLIENSSFLISFPYTMDLMCKRQIEVFQYFVDMMIGPQDFAWGMAYSFWCNEELPFEDLAHLRDHPNLPVELSGIALTVVPLPVRGIWPQRIPDPFENHPVHSQVPALIFSGQYDPDTPAEFARRIAATLPHGLVLTFPGQSHLQIFTQPCAATLVRQFLDDPSRQPETSCLGGLPPLKFHIR